ncbi:hypothetical protein G6F68_013198 [Rhizopus microsporus]|nr:hypothetical protein G6F68_013198 [Rhizopus microsporus]
MGLVLDVGGCRCAAGSRADGDDVTRVQHCAGTGRAAGGLPGPPAARIRGRPPAQRPANLPCAAGPDHHDGRRTARQAARPAAVAPVAAMDHLADPLRRCHQHRVHPAAGACRAGGAGRGRDAPRDRRYPAAGGQGPCDRFAAAGRGGQCTQRCLPAGAAGTWLRRTGRHAAGLGGDRFRFARRLSRPPVVLASQEHPAQAALAR